MVSITEQFLKALFEAMTEYQKEKLETQKLPSKFQIGDKVNFFGLDVVVVCVQFTKSKVYYDLEISYNGIDEVIKDIDSIHINERK